MTISQLLIREDSKALAKLFCLSSFKLNSNLIFSYSNNTVHPVRFTLQFFTLILKSEIATE